MSKDKKTINALMKYLRVKKNITIKGPKEKKTINEYRIFSWL